MKIQCQDKDDGVCPNDAGYLMTIEKVKNNHQSFFCAKHTLELIHGKLVILEEKHEPESEHVVLIPLNLLK